MQLAGEHLDRDRPAGLVTQQPVNDLRRARACHHASTPAWPAGTSAPRNSEDDVVEHKLPVLEVPPGEPILDPLLALKQPVHRRIQIVLIGTATPNS